MDVVVVGAGIVGAAIAYELSRSGARVTVLDSGDVCAGTSASSFAWLGNFPHAVGYAPLSERGLRLQVDSRLRARTERDWHAWEQRLAAGLVHRTGTVSWGDGDSMRGDLDAAQQAATAAGVRVERVGRARVREIAPALDLGTVDVAFFEPEGGWVEVPNLVAALLSTIEVRTNSRVEAVEREAASVTGVRTAAGEHITADQVVLAAGSWTTHLAATADVSIPLHLFPGLLVYARPRRRLSLPVVVRTPTCSVRPNSDDTFVLNWRPTASQKEPDLNAVDPHAVVREAATWIPGMEAAEIVSSRVGIRPVPPDGPIVGRPPGTQGLYLAVSHGGVRWAPTWGRLVAEEITTGRVTDELGPMRPARFFAEPDTARA